MKYIINNKLFETQISLKEYVQNILHSYSDGQELSNAHYSFMLELLSYHPDNYIKVGVGIKSMFVKQNPLYRNTRCFWLIRLDNSITDFSYLECLKGTGQEKKFINCCRVAIEPYTKDFKKNFFNNLEGSAYFCPYTNEQLYFIGSHVHHKQPNTFEQLVKDFINENNVDISQVKINSGAMDNKFQDTFIEKEFEQLWIDYHNNHAELQIVSKTANLTILK